MRALGACLALTAFAAAAGCLNDDGAVRLAVTDARGLAPPISGYSASNAAVAVDASGRVHFTATSNQGILSLQLDGPLAPSTTIDLAAAPSAVDFTIGDASWSNDGGTLVIESVHPVIVNFAAVPMSARSAAAGGEFVFSGSGTFR
jgi:hypothetical protein